MTDFARILPTPLLVLLALAFLGCQEGGDAGATNNAAPPPAAAGTTGLNIVFVKIDSLQAGYTEVAGELARLEENYNQAEKNIGASVQALQQEASKLQNQAQQGLLAPNKIQSEQQRLARREQEIMQQRDVALNSIQQDQLAIQQRFSERVKKVLEELQEEEGYDFILNQGQNSAVLITNDAYDITPAVLQRLNAVTQDTL